MSVSRSVMKGLVVGSVSCFVILLQFHVVFCDAHTTNRKHDNDERTRRYHESDCPKERLKKEKNKMVKNLNIIAQKPKCAPKSIIRDTHPIKEMKEPKDIRIINNILEEIANVAHNHNETKGIKKIKHLVEEIVKQEENESRINKTKHNINKPAENDIVVLNHTKTKEKSLHDSTTTLKTVSNKESTIPTKINKPSTNGRPFNDEVCKDGDKVPMNQYDYERPDERNENLIEIKEHKYEEEILQYNWYKNNQASTYTNWCMDQNNNPGYYNRPYDYDANNNGIEIYEANNPTCTYGDKGYGNTAYYAVNYNGNSEQSKEREKNYMTHRKTWLDRNTKIKMGFPDDHLIKTIKEDRKEIINEQSPEFSRKYYRDRTKQYCNNNIELNSL